MSRKTEVTVYSAESPLRHPLALARSVVSDLLRCRQLIWILFLRDLRSQFRQSLLGYVWLVLPPFATAAIWVILRSQRIIKVETEVPYIIFVMIGTTLWVSFLAFLRAPLLGFKNGKAVYTKLNVPVEAFIFSSILRVSFDTCIRLSALIPVFLLSKYVPASTFYLFPVALVCSFSIAVGLGILIVPIGGFYDDIGNAIANVTRVLMYTVPVIIPLGRSGWLNELMERNPLTPGVAFFRDVLTTGSMEWAGLALLYGGIMMVLGFFGLLMIRVAKPHLITRMGM